MSDHRDRNRWSGAGKVGERVAMLAQQPLKPAVELADPLVELLDLTRELPDAVRRGVSGEPALKSDKTSRG